jgi:hypothetical protein
MDVTLRPSEPGSALSRWWRSRLGLRFAVEVLFMLGLYVVYKFARYAVRDRLSVAFDNAREIVHIERVLGLFTEERLQDLAMRNVDLIRFLNQYYVTAHFTVIGLYLIWLYIAHDDGYRRSRRILISTTLLGMAVHVAYPLAPPRMLPDLGFVDTGRVFGPSAYGPQGVFSGLANQFAAMPSLHFGWAVLVAWGVIHYAKGRWRWIALAHPVLTLASITITANHYFADAAVAAVVLGVAFAVDRRLFERRRSSFRPVAPTVGGLTVERGIDLTSAGDGRDPLDTRVLDEDCSRL